MSDSAPPRATLADVKALTQRQARRVTSYDVASLAGVSQSAVSRCFQTGASVSKATLERVMQAARELDYTPNPAARSLMTRRSNQVALVISHAAALYCPELLSEMSCQFARQDMRILLFPLPSGAEAEPTLARLWQHQVDAVVVAASLTPVQIAEFDRRSLPFILFNLPLEGSAVNLVACDQAAGARLMVSRLAAAGHQRFAMIEGPRHCPIAQQRTRGAAARLAELGLAAPLVVSGHYDYASGGRGLRAIIGRLGHVPDAIICGNDVMAIGCLDTARHELQLDVPGALSITGFDGIAQASWLSYDLTTLRQPMADMVGAAGDLLVELIGRTGAAPQRRIFTGTIAEGATARLGPAF